MGGMSKKSCFGVLLPTFVLLPQTVQAGGDYAAAYISGFEGKNGHYRFSVVFRRGGAFVFQKCLFGRQSIRITAETDVLG